MESKIRSSFIPKKSVTETSAAPRTRYKSSGIDVIMLIAIVSLVIAGVLASGIFLYKNLAVKDAANKKEMLENASGAFEPKLIKELMLLSNRIRIAESILEKHTAPSVFLQALEKDTLTGVQFTEFSYEQENSDTAIFSLKGKTGSVNSVALQSSRFGESSLIQNSIFSDIDLVKDGVSFNVEGNVNLASIRYTSVVSNYQPQQVDFVNQQGSDTMQMQQNNTVSPPEPTGEFGDFGSFE